MKRRYPSTRLTTGLAALSALLSVLPALLLAGCEQTPILDRRVNPQTPDHPKATAVLQRDAPARPREREREREAGAAPARDGGGLREGIQLYNEGDFNGAIKRLSSRDVGNGPLANRLMALKYTAFSYCVTSRPAQCRQAFDRALRLDPGFDLAPGEHGHPLWGPVFTKAKQSVAAR